MMNISNFFTILIMISSSFYPAFALDTSQTCDTSILPPRWPSSHIYVTDTNESQPYIPLTYHTSIFHDDDVWNTSSQPKTVHVTLTIREHGQQVFNQTQSLQMQPCSGPESVKWRFVPIQSDNYDATVSDNRGDVGMIFYSMLDATKSQTVSLPLEQLRFGVDSHNVICRQDLQLVIKSQDSSPACVKPDTAQKLVERGWANSIQVNTMSNLANDTGTITLGNRTYYFETPTYIHDSHFNSSQISFHRVVFTLFPAGFRGGLPIPCSTHNTFQYYWTDVKFADDSHELLHILGASPPCETNPIPSMFSNHTNPQAGLAFYDGKMKLLTSVEN